MSDVKHLLSSTRTTAVELAGERFLVEEIVDRHGPRYAISDPRGREVRDRAVAKAVLAAYAMHEADPETAIEEWEMVAEEARYGLTVDVSDGDLRVTAAVDRGGHRRIALNDQIAAELTERLCAAKEE
jgi:hypothetical protein